MDSVLWDAPLIEQQNSLFAYYVPPVVFDDVDCNGALDAVVAIRPSQAIDGAKYLLKAVSLDDGKTIWSQTMEFHAAPRILPELATGDIDGDGRTEVIVSEKRTATTATEPLDHAPNSRRPAASTASEGLLTVLDGRDGSLRWTWRGSRRWDFALVCLANLDGTGRHRLAQPPGIRAGCPGW